MVSVDEMIRIVKECQEIIRKAQDGNKNSATGERSKGLPDQRGDEIHN
jgi:hypothetical protein